MGTRYFLLIATLVAIFTGYSHSARIQFLTPILPYSINQNYTTEYIFEVYIPSPISNEAYLEIQFPFPLKTHPACAVYIKTPEDSYTKYPCDYVHSGLLIHIGKIVPGRYEFFIENVSNPSSDDIGNFYIRTYINRTTLIDESEGYQSTNFLQSPCKNFLNAFH